MKNKKIYKILLILVLLFLVSNFYPNAKAASNLSIWGYVKDKEGKAKEGVIVTVEGSSYNATTNERGYYEINGLSQGTYSLKFDYSNLGNLYETENIEMFQLDKYTDKLEIAFVHDNSINIEDYIAQIKKITTEQASGSTISPRILDLKYTNEESLRSIINNLRTASNSENAFHKTQINGWKSVAVICYNSSIEYNITHINPLINNNNYDIVIKKYDASEENVIKGIYQRIINNEPEKVENINPTDEDNHMKVNINLQKDSMVNVRVKRGTVGLVLDDSHDGFISGKVIADGNIVNDRLKITLVKDSGEKITRYTENGEYKFGYPQVGKYRIEFSFDTTEINGQNYEVDSNYKSINNTTSPEQNSVNPSDTNIQELKEKFKKIGYSEERTLDNNTAECALTGYTDWFYINGTYDSKYGGIVLKEREKFGLEVNSELTAFKIILSDGQTLADWSKSDNQEVNNVLSTGENGAFILTMDNELRYGATIYAEYNITVTNNRNIDCKSFTLVNGNDLQCDLNSTLLTDTNIKNADIGWKGIENVDEYVSNVLDSALVKKEYIKLSDEIKAGETKVYRLKLSKLVDSDCAYSNVAEIAEYENDQGRRNFNSNNEKIRAGNYWNEEITEADTGISKALMIMPPFGENVKMFIIAICTTILLIIINVMYNNKKAKKNKRRKMK